MNLAGNYSDALTYFDSALVINPNDPNIWEKRASALQNLGNYAAAITSNNLALSFYSGDIKFFNAFDVMGIQIKVSEK
jgi:tetratricopeptide (TPR) repeat protein